MPNEFRGDREIVLEAVRISGKALLHVSDELRSDREIVMEAIYTYGRALEYASYKLRNDKILCLFAIRNIKGFISPYILQRDNITDAIKNNHIAFENQIGVHTVYTINYDIEQHKIIVTTMSAKQFKLDNIIPETTINEIGNRIFNEIHQQLNKSSEFYLVYEKKFICPFDGNNEIKTYLQYNHKGGNYNKYLKYKNKYLKLKNQL